MDRRTLLASAAALASATAGCSVFGGSDTPKPTPTQEPLDVTATDEDASTGTGEATGTGTAAGPDIDFHVDLTNVEKCGRTCRTLTFTVQNRGSDPAPSTSVRVAVSTGGEQVHEETFDVGDIGAQKQRSGIERDVDVGMGAGSKIKDNGGDVTIEMTPRSGDYVGETFAFERTLDV